MEHVDPKTLYEYLNLGCEMIYILDQRLRDAKIGKEKKQKVLEAIWDKFTADEEFYRINANDFKVQFSRIAQSSIMKLNEVSMSKLFDLMIMALKYQTFHSHHPDEMYLVLINHFHDVHSVYSTISYQYQQEIKNFFITRVESIFKSVPTYKWLLMRRKILNDYQNSKIRISMFLRQKLQNEDSSFKILPQKRLSMGFSNPGKTFISKKNTIEWKPATEIMETTAAIQNSLEFEKTRIFTCGSNIYAKPELLGGKNSADQNTTGDSAKGGHFKQEITAMRSIVGNSSSTDCSDEIAFSILEDDQASGKSGVSSSKRPENIKTINAKSDHSNVQSLINDLKELKSADTAVGNADETDLLAMMDSV